MSLLPGDFVPNTWGANLVGTMLSCMSFGVLCTVGWTYFSRFPNDRWAYKILAVLVVTLSTVDTVISTSPPRPRLLASAADTVLRSVMRGADCNYTYTALITHYGTELDILLENWNFQTNIVLIGISCVILQGFMSYRIWIVTERRWRIYPVASVALAVAALVIAIW